MRYRPDVDGLRAIAVLPVIFFHAGLDAWSGGFVGVDVFFVISGYLITSLILAEKLEGRFSILTFYERRARRILPVLFCVMLVCLPFAWFWMLPYEMENFSRSILAVVFFVSNILFWRQTGYFATDAALEPLLHTWSLAVEEQYYFFFPLAFLACWRLGLRWVIGLFVLAGLASFAVAYWGATNRPDATFYLLPTRGWELLVGATIALVYQQYRDRSAKWAAGQSINQVLSFLGVALIGYAVFRFDGNIPFPGPYALVPTLGAALIILASSPEVVIGRVLSHPWIVKVGLISYSAYLWHQPLFAFARLRSVTEPSEVVFLCLAISSIVLAYFSWRYVERPFRDAQRITRKGVLVFVLLASAFMIAVAIAGIYTKGFTKRFPREFVELAVSPSDRGAYVVARHTELRKALGFSNAGKKKLAVIGDSYSEDFVNMIGETGAFRNYEIRTHYIHTKCQLYVGPEDEAQAASKVNRQACRENDEERLRRLVKDADVLIFAASWKDWSVRRLPQTFQNLNIAADKAVFVVGAKNFGSINLRRYIDVDIETRKKLRNVVSEQFLQTNELLPSFVRQGEFIDIHKIVCGAKARDCPVFTDEGKLISHDGGHLTKDGAIFVGKKIFSQSALSQFN